MKKTNNIILILLLAVFGTGFYACSDDMVKSDYDYKSDSSLTLATIQFSALIKESDEMISLSATITNKGESPIYDQGFIYSTDQSFKTYTTISVTPSDDQPNLLEISRGIDQGKDFYFKAFILTRDGFVTSSDVKSINLPITWEKVGTVIFTDGFWNGGEAEVEIQKFFGQNRYRLIDLYNMLDEEVPTGKHFEFILDDDANAVSFPIGDQDIFVSPYIFHWDNVNWGGYCFFTNNANVYSIGAVVKENGTVSYIYSSSFEWIEGYPGEIPEPVEPLEVSYKTDFSNEAGKAGWVLDKYSGTGEDDLVFYFDMAEIGKASLGNAVASYYETETLKIISPSISVAESDTLSFGIYSGLFGSQMNAKVKVYIREVGGELNLTTPVKDWNLAKSDGFTAIPLDAYEGKDIKVIYVVEQGDFIFYRFAVAPSSNQSLIFP